jgi:hypothetical protein
MRRPLTAHCFARRCCQNPTPISAIESTRNYERNCSRNALAPAAPMAAAKPNGTQHAMVARELTMATTEAEKPVPDLTVSLPSLLRGRHGESSPAAVRPAASRPDRIGRRPQKIAVLGRPRYRGR